MVNKQVQKGSLAFFFNFQYYVVPPPVIGQGFYTVNSSWIYYYYYYYYYKTITKSPVQSAVIKVKQNYLWLLHSNLIWKLCW